MKKALIYLTFSLMVLMGILAYDIIKCDGNVILNPLLNVDRTYSSSATNNSADNTARKQKEITVTVPDIKNYPDMDVKEVETKESDLLDVVEVENVDDADRGYEFYFGFLSEKEKNVYRAMYNAFACIESGNVIPTCNDDEMNRVATAIKDDHPELFYLGELGYTHYTLGGQVQRSTLSVKYTDSDTIINTKRNMVESEAQAIINTIPAGADEYTKIKYVYDAVINMTEYDLNAPDNQTIVSVLVNKRSVCAGYTRTMQYILNKIGIPTTMVEGNSLISGEEHAWNLCKLSDGYYFIDATWGDASYTNSDSKEGAVRGVNYDYLLVTSEELLKTHSINSFVDIPVCTATANNYYVREGLYLTEFNYDYIKSIFDAGYANGAESVSFKCADSETYDEVVRQLIKGNLIFEMLNDSSKTVSYVNDPEQRTLCFWL